MNPHKVLAQAAFGTTYSHEQYEAAKALNFGRIYAVSDRPRLPLKMTPAQQLAAMQRYMIFLGKIHPFNEDKPRLIEPKAAFLAHKKFLEYLRSRGAIREQVRELAAQLAPSRLGDIQTQIAELAPEDIREDLRHALMQYEGERRLLNFLLEVSGPSGGRRFEPLR